jgi:GntR family transcriptional regulator
MNKYTKPLHSIIAEELKRKIREGEYPPGSQLPAETELAASLQVSRATLREALSLLEREGSVIRRHGVGSFVRDSGQDMATNFNKLESMRELISRSGFTASIQVLENRVGPLDPDSCAALELPEGSEGLIIRTLYSATGIPIVCTEEYAPASLIPSPLLRERKDCEDLSEFLALNTKRQPVSTLTRIKGLLPTPEIMAILMIDNATPVIRQRFVLYDKARAPVGCGYDFFNSSWFEFTIFADSVRL